GKSSLMLYEQFGDLKFKYRNREFWCRGYYVDTVGKNTARIQECNERCNSDPHPTPEIRSRG
ncbi:transposase, partial [Yersinia pestis]